MYSKGYTLGLTRTLAPGHFIFQIVMAILLIRALNSKGIKKTFLTILSLLIPMLLHACFNTFNINNAIIMIIIGGISYLFAIIYIIKLPKEITAVKKYPFKLISCILITLLTFYIYSSNTSYSMNKDVYIKEDNITINVMNVEKIKKIESYDSNKYKIKVKLTNNNDNKSFKVFLMDFKLTNDTNNQKYALYASDENDNELDDITIEAGETRTLYFYVLVDDFKYNYFNYRTNELNPSTYTFTIK